MQGALICYVDDNVILLGYGSYSEMEKKLNIYKKLITDREVKLINVDGIDIFNISKDQSLINEALKLV